MLWRPERVGVSAVLSLCFLCSCLFSSFRQRDVIASGARVRWHFLDWQALAREMPDHTAGSVCWCPGLVQRSFCLAVFDFVSRFSPPPPPTSLSLSHTHPCDIALNIFFVQPLLSLPHFTTTTTTFLTLTIVTETILSVKIYLPFTSIVSGHGVINPLMLTATGIASLSLSLSASLAILDHVSLLSGTTLFTSCLRHPSTCRGLSARSAVFDVDSPRASDKPHWLYHYVFPLFFFHFLL